MGAKELIIEGKTALGIELGSTRIKGVLIDYQGNVLAVGIHDWENSFIDNIWTYSLAEIHADLVFDVRFLPNPYYIDELRPKSGNDKEVREYVMDNDKARMFLAKLTDMVEFLIPNYVQEGKTQLVIGIGCTGGKHRSVTLANELYEALSKNDNYGIRIEHRDIGKDAVTKAR